MSSHHDPVLRDLQDIIERYGWAVRHVAPVVGEGGTTLSYTIGLTAMGHPEVLVTGLPVESAHIFLNNVGNDVRAGRTFRHGDVTTDYTDGAAVVFIEARDTTELTAVQWIYGRVSALQLVWPDSTGRLPWQTGYRNRPDAQPLLGSIPDGV